MGNVGILPFGDSAIEGGEVGRLEGDLEGAELVGEAAERPYVAFVAVLLARPYLGAGVVGSPSLGRAESVLSQLRNIQVPKLGDSVCKENVGAFDIPVDDIVLVENPESLEELNGNLPDKLFLESRSRLAILPIDDFVLCRAKVTWRSPPSAYSMRTHSSLV